MHLKLFRPSSNEEIDMHVAFNSKLPNQELFADHGLSALKKITLSPTSNPELNTLSINIYPNPSHGVFTLTMNKWPKDLQIFLDDMKGNRIAVFKPGLQSQGSTYQLNLAHLPNGVYYLKLVHSSSMQIKKIVIN